jgi:hypothetical protein
MDTSKLKKFAQFARRTLIGQVSAKLDSVLAPGAAARREHPEAMKKLDAAIARDGKTQVIERVAYIWFNRFTALRFMDVNDLNPVRVISPLSGQFQPEILAEAKAGNIDEDRVPDKVRAQARALLDGRVPSPDAQAEAYRLLLVAICNDWHRVMPFLFERIDDYTELLLPEDLLSNASILAYLREAMTPDVCEDVEAIGWLYQFYISEKKDEVFAGLKKNQKITAENIPAATQLFTPHWIVRYLVENSLGRLWLLNRPGSRLKERMDYYIAPEQPETDFLRISRPEEIKVCDPACGSGHMLTYAFDLLHAIYEEEGYDPPEIPSLILKHNLTGLEIDDRAGAMAGFALAMKAAAKLGRRRFLRMEVKPDVVVLQNVTFTPAEMQDVAAVVGRDLFSGELRETLLQFEQAKNFGSLITPKLCDPAETLRVVKVRDFGSDLLLKEVQDRVVAVLRMAEALSRKHHVVVANPPYMGAGGMNGILGNWVKAHYPEGKSDLFSAFIERGILMTLPKAYTAMVTMESWMFLSSFERLRSSILSKTSIQSLVHMPYLGKGGTSMGINFGTSAFVLTCALDKKRKAQFFCIRYFETDDEGVPHEFPPQNERLSLAASDDIGKIPGSPISYWIRKFDLFDYDKISDGWKSGGRLKTHDGPRFIRFGWEVSAGSTRWKKIAKGGDFRRFFGNEESVADWSPSALHHYESLGGLPPKSFLGKEGVTWTKITSALPSFRIKSANTEYDSASPTIFSTSLISNHFALGFLNTKVSTFLLNAINPTMNFQVADVLALPSLPAPTQRVEQNVLALISYSKSDWDAYETSWDFTTLPLLSPDHRAATLEATYARLRAHWRGMTDEMQRLEEENNRIFIDVYGLQDELKPEVPIEEITLNCNPAYRYGGNKPSAELEVLLLADTMREFVSYAVGCMFGRYSLDASGLILANQGETLVDYLARVPKPCFMPDEDNVIPMLDGDWFADDVTERFRRFLRVTFDEEHFQENLALVEEALGKDIRRYFTRDFFNDHVKRYKKRPIYWLFSSPKGTFNALIYMHRYRPDTVSVVLNDYLREFRSKLEAYRRAQEALSISGDASPAQKTKALKEIEATARQIEELDAWERDVLFPLATQKIEIDLDDGVKANYPKFGAALKPIKGLNDSDD